MERPRRLTVAARAATVVFAAAFLVWFVAWPVAAIVARGLWTDGSLHLGAVLDVVREPRTRHIVAFTFEQATVSSAFALALGLPLAFVVERWRPVGSGLMRVLVFVPFALPTVVVGAAFAAVFGGEGPLAVLGWMRTPTIIVIAHVYFNLAVVVRIVGARWRVVNPHLRDAARSLGASPVRVFARVTVPALANAIVGAVAIVWLFCATSFGVIVVLGGVRTRTIETEIYRLTTQELALDRAAGLVVVQLVAVGAALLVAARFQRSGATTSGAVGAVAPRGRLVRTGLYAYAVFVVALLAAPVVTIVMRAFETDALGFRLLGDRSRLGWRPVDAIKTSLVYAGWATAIAVTLGLVVTWASARGWPGHRVLLGASALPLGVSAVSIGFGFLIALDRPVDLRANWFLVPIAQATVALPFVLRTLVPVLSSIDPNVREAAATLGASPRQVARRIDLAILAPAIGTAAAFAMAISLGEFGATAFIARADAPTMPIAIARLLGRPGAGSRASAYALAAIMVLVIGVLAGLAARIGNRRSVA